MNNISLFCKSAALCVVLLTRHCDAQTLLNGSFEAPVLPANSSQNNDGGTDWTPTGNSTVNLFTNSAGDGTTPYGTQWVALVNTGASDAQTISSGFTADTTYEISVACANIDGSTSAQLTLSVAFAGNGSTTTFSQSFAIPSRTGGYSNTALPFLTYTLAFTPATSGAATVTLSDTGGGALGIDNAVLTVPEPSTWVMSIGALFFTGIGRYMRRARHE